MIENTTIFTREELYALFGKEHCHQLPAQCTSVTTDTRFLRSGALFIALAGERFDGHDHILTALDKGVSAIILLREKAPLYSHIPHIAVEDTLFALGELARFHRHKFSIPVIAVAGAAGKTSTKELIAHCCASQAITLKTESNYNNRVGVPLTLLQLQAHHQAAVIEIGTNEPGEIERLAHIVSPTVGVITNIGKEHLEKLRDLDGVEQEETALFRFLDNSKGIPVINIDDERLARYAMLDNSLTFSTRGDADVATTYTFDSELHPQLSVYFCGSIHQCRLNTIGLTAVLNATAAIAACLAAGMELDSVLKALAEYAPAETHGYARMVVQKIHGITFLNDCYNANPESMALALQTLHDYPTHGKKIAVLADMRELGDATDIEHQVLINNAITKAHHLIVIGEYCIKAALSIQSDTISIAASHEQCAQQLLALCKADDIVLIKGSRGMKMEKVIELFKKEHYIP